MRFPRRIKHRGKTLATIYGRTHGNDFFRVSWSVNGKRRQKAFTLFGGEDGALAFAEQTVKELARGSQASVLTPAQATDALAAIERLQGFYASTGKRFSILAAVSEFCEAAGKLNGHSMREAVDGFVSTVASVKRKDIAEAVEQFLESRQHQTEAADGKRAQLSESYERHVAFWLRGFAQTFPGTSLSELTKEHVNACFAPLRTKVGTKNRNDRRAIIKMFFEWATREDYLARNHRLNEANAMKREKVDDAGATDFYRPSELRRMLHAADAELLPMLAIGALGGLRIEEITRLGWEDVWRVSGHIEVSAKQAKARARRLVEICPALSGWLEPYRGRTGIVFAPGAASHLVHAFGRRFTKLRNDLQIPARRNGLRHGFGSFHFALLGNENLTAKEMGNSPAMVHAHYKGLATKAEAQQWFSVAPATAANIIPIALEA